MHAEPLLPRIVARLVEVPGSPPSFSAVHGRAGRRRKPPTRTSGFTSARRADRRRSPAPRRGRPQRRSRLCDSHRHRGVGAAHRRRRVAQDRRRQGGSPLPANRSRGGFDGRVSRRASRHDLPAGSSTRLLLGDLDGRSRLRGGAQRSGGPLRAAEGRDGALSGRARRRHRLSFPLGNRHCDRQRRAGRPARRCDPHRGLSLPGAVVPRPGPVRSEPPLPDQREGRLAKRLASPARSPRSRTGSPAYGRRSAPARFPLRSPNSARSITSLETSSTRSNATLPPTVRTPLIDPIFMSCANTLHRRARGSPKQFIYEKQN